MKSIDPDLVTERLENWWNQQPKEQFQRKDIYQSIRSFLEVRLPEAEYILEEYCVFLVLRVEAGLFSLDRMEESLIIYQTLLISKGALN